MPTRRDPPALFESLAVREQVTFVVHDWGSALGFDWANRHRDAVRNIAYVEALDCFTSAALELRRARSPLVSRDAQSADSATTHPRAKRTRARWILPSWDCVSLSASRCCARRDVRLMSPRGTDFGEPG